MTRALIPLAERWAKKVQKTEGCWLWTGATNGVGYGRMKRNATEWVYAHRAAYEMFVGPIPEGHTLDHLCRNRACVRPDHLEAVTRWENVRRSPTSWMALRSKATHCIRGHEFTPENTYRTGPDNRHRRCRTCSNAHAMRYYHQRKAAHATGTTATGWAGMAASPVCRRLVGGSTD